MYDIVDQIGASVRSLDAIHVAAPLSIEDDELNMITYDERMTGRGSCERFARGAAGTLSRHAHSAFGSQDS